MHSMSVKLAESTRMPGAEPPFNSMRVRVACPPTTESALSAAVAPRRRRALAASMLQSTRLSSLFSTLSLPRRRSLDMCKGGARCASITRRSCPASAGRSLVVEVPTIHTCAGTEGAGALGGGVEWWPGGSLRRCGAPRWLP
eukprot:564281-Prymnesium_polylepis.1